MHLAELLEMMNANDDSQTVIMAELIPTTPAVSKRYYRDLKRIETWFDYHNNYDNSMRLFSLYESS